SCTQPSSRKHLSQISRPYRAMPKRLPSGKIQTRPGCRSFKTSAKYLMSLINRPGKCQGLLDYFGMCHTSKILSSQDVRVFFQTSIKPSMLKNRLCRKPLAVSEGLAKHKLPLNMLIDTRATTKPFSGSKLRRKRR